MKIFILSSFIVLAYAQRDNTNFQECATNRTYSRCITNCPQFCEPQPPTFAACTEDCVSSGCACSPGYVIDQETGNCILIEECPSTENIDCGLNAEWNDCGPSCPITCANRKSTDNYCNNDCVEGCSCKVGFLRNNQGDCIEEIDCPDH